MQNYTLGDPLSVLTIETTIALILLVSYGLYRYSRGVQYQLWALGWMTYTTTAVSTIVIRASGLVLTDSIATSGMLVSSILLFDGAKERKRKGSSLLVYFVAAAIGIVAVQIGILLEISYGIVFSFFGIATAFSCWYSAIHFRRSVVKKSVGFWISYTGFILWGFSTLLILPFELLFLLDFQVLITSTGVIATGAGLLSCFIRSTAENLGAQYQISHLLGSILSHDVRNYVGTLSESINQAIASEQDREMWLELASEIVTHMTDFVMEMRYITATVARVESEKISMKLASILEDVSTRVAREYGLESGKIVVDLDENVSIISCKIVKEMFWNILDNAFKHGAKNLTVRAIRNKKEDVIVEILDRAGGLPIEIQEFLNDPDALSSPSAPGVGLGIIIIRGLALLCDIPIKTQDVIEDEQVVGTLFQLQFKHRDLVVISE